MHPRRLQDMLANIVEVGDSGNLLDYQGQNYVVGVVVHVAVARLKVLRRLGVFYGRKEVSVCKHYVRIRRSSCFKQFSVRWKTRGMREQVPDGYRRIRKFRKVLHYGII